MNKMIILLQEQSRNKVDTIANARNDKGDLPQILQKLKNKKNKL